jgi:LDH2 family malate/lactate/ureidoglycolate dehydrogenase
MIVAHTELRDILNKVFEGMGFHLGDYEDCANNIAWMELHGWPVLKDVLKAPTMPRSEAARFLYEDQILSVIDAKNNGGLIYGSLALDLAALKAKNQAAVVIKLVNAANPQLIMPSLPHCAGAGLNVLVTWQVTDQNFVVFMAANEKYPTVATFSANTAAADSDLTIVCGLAVSFSLPTESNSNILIRPVDFQEQYDFHIKYGISIDDAQWQQLVSLSKNILVEATETSRLKGAGEDAL